METMRWLAAGLLVCVVGCGKGKISGTVTNTGSKAIAGATVKADPAGKSATTDSSGKYSLDEVARGDQSVTASAAGYVDQAKSVKIGGTFKGDEATLDFSLGSGFGTAHSLTGTKWDYTYTGTQSDGTPDNGTGTFTFASEGGGTFTRTNTSGGGTDSGNFTVTSLTHPADTSGEHTDNIVVQFTSSCNIPTFTGTRKGPSMSGTYSSTLVSPPPAGCTNAKTVSGTISATQK